jgi:predicted transposase/invertase (TIGR01784 family)
MTTTEKYFIPFTGFGFEKLFGTEDNKDLLISFLNQLIQDQGTITDVTYLSSKQLGIYHGSAIDIYCKTENGCTFIVEMKKEDCPYFKTRKTFYHTFPILNKMEEGGWNYDIKPVYFIGILNYAVEEDKNKETETDRETALRRQVYLLDAKTNNKIEFICIEATKFNKEEKELVTMLDKWLYILKNLPRLEKRPAILREKIFAKLFKIAELAKFSEKEAKAYDDSLKIYRDNRAAIAYRDKSTVARIIIGLEVGKENGIKDGIETGIARVAMSLYKMGRPVAEIAEATGIAKKKIKYMIEDYLELLKTFKTLKRDEKKLKASPSPSKGGDGKVEEKKMTKHN